MKIGSKILYNYFVIKKERDEFMTKELFIHTIETMRALNKEQEDFDAILKRIDNEFGGGYLHNKTISLLADILKEVTNDKYDYISYYLWEIDFGNEYYDGCITEEDGTVIPLKTAEDLYNLIMSNDK